MTATVGPHPPRLRRDVAVLVTGTAAGQLALVASTPLLSRLFEPSEVGVFGAFSALESILVVIACLRFDQALSLSRSRKEARSLLQLAVAAAVATSLLIGVATMLLPESWQDTLGVGALAWLPVLLAGTVLCDAVGQALTSWAVRRRDLVGVARSRAVVGVTQAGGQVGSGLVGAGSGGLAVGYLAGRLAAVIHLARRGRRADEAVDTPWDGAAAPLPRWRYPVFAAPAALLNAGALQVPLLLVAARYDAAAVGALVLATRLAAAPMQLAGQSVTQALSARLAQVVDPLAADLRPQLGAAARRLGVAGAVVAVPMVVAGPLFTGWLLGDEWRIAGRFAQLLAPAMALQLVVAPLAVVLAVKGRQARQLIWDALRLVAVVAAVLVPAATGASVTTAIAVLSTVLVGAYLALLVLVWRAAAPVGQAPS